MKQPAKEIINATKAKFDSLDKVVQKIASTPYDKMKGLIITGSQGIGKSWAVKSALEKVPSANVTLIKGHCTPYQVYLALLTCAAEGNVIIFDDCDDVFNSIAAMNLLKAALDPTAKFKVSWMSSRAEITEFFFHGKIIIITNYQMHTSPHYQALLDRYLYFHFTLEVDEIRAKSVEVAWNMIDNCGYDTKSVEDAQEWFYDLEDQHLTFRRLTSAIELAVQFGEDWKDFAQTMLFNS